MIVAVHGHILHANNVRSVINENHDEKRNRHPNADFPIVRNSANPYNMRHDQQGRNQVKRLSQTINEQVGVLPVGEQRG